MQTKRLELLCLQSVLCDVGLVARGDGHSWSLEDKLYLEAALVMATAEPLCLEPTVGVAVVSNWLQHKKARLSSHMINRCLPTPYDHGIP